MVHRFCPHGFGEFTIGIASKFDDGRRAEDLCSIPDLVGGTTSEVLNLMEKESIPCTTNLLSPVYKRLSMKTRLIFVWSSMLAGPLKKLTCMVRPTDGEGVRFSFGDPCAWLNDPSHKQLWLPPDLKWKRSAGEWFR